MVLRCRSTNSGNADRKHLLIRLFFLPVFDIGKAGGRLVGIAIVAEALLSTTRLYQTEFLYYRCAALQVDRTGSQINFIDIEPHLIVIQIPDPTGVL